MTWVLGVAVGLIGLWATYTVVYEGGLESPDFVLVEKDGDFEVRDYPSFRIAGTSMPEDVDEGRSFRVLAGYIFGGNKAEESMAMTAPVIQQYGAGEGLPSAGSDPSGSTRMAFVMPAARSLDELPQPNSGAVELAEVDWGLMAAVRFSGRGRLARFHAAEKRLRAWMSGQGVAARGEVLYAQYNSPSAFPPLRRNEVLIPVTVTGEGR